jgi:tRNA(adenine34) deaminase
MTPLLLESETENEFMAEAVAEAKNAAEAGEIPVGAVIVRDGDIISRGRNSNRTDNMATRHAEIAAIESASRALGNERLLGCSLYVTKEPCAMCAGAIIHSRIEHVYIGAPDIKYGAAGTVFDILGNAKFNHIPQITFGVMEKECVKLLKEFFAQLRKK